MQGRPTEFQRLCFTPLPMAQQDLLQIGLEHHHGGRLRQAEAAYRELATREPENADALHWLGVLLHQAGEWQEAKGYLQRAADLRPNYPAFQHNLGHVLMTARQHDAAVQAFEKTTLLDPNRAEAWLGLGLARLARGHEGDGDLAIEALEKARSGGVDTPELHQQLGVAMVAGGRMEAAVESLQRALAKEPNDPSTHFHLALAWQARGETKEVRKSLLKAAELNPRFAKAWYGLGILEAEAGKWDVAAGLFRRALSVKDDYAAAYHALAHALRQAGKDEEAERVEQQAEWAISEARRASAARHAAQGSVEELEQKITPDKQKLELHYALAKLTKVAPPTIVPAAAVVDLFDRYADKFDDHLQNRLRYNVPEQIAELVRRVTPGEKFNVLDLGCGTGLVGAAIKPMAKSLTGVDLSPKMIEKSRERGIYDRLEQADIVEALNRWPASFDLIASADVLIYVGDLMPIFEAVAKALRPGGRFAYSVEAGAGERYVLLPNRRYAHSADYLKRLASMYGFTEESFSTTAIRTEAEKPVAGHVAVIRLA